MLAVVLRLGGKTGKAVLAVLAVVLRLGGKTGKAVLAGAAGGLLRWLMQERRRPRDGIVSVTGGVIASIYLGPVVGAIMTQSMGPIGSTQASGFVAGLAGMSLAKMIVAIVETAAGRMREGGK